MLKDLANLKKNPWDISYPSIKADSEQERKERNLQTAYQSFSRALDQLESELKDSDILDRIHLYNIFHNRWLMLRDFFGLPRDKK